MSASSTDAPAETPAIETAALRSLGLRRADCPALYRETAEAATDTDLPFWAVLLLSGTIALFGLALNATAVVIGAMLVAPLLGPLLGLSLALAVGDGRLAVQTGVTILLGALGVIAVSAALTLALPFQDVTAEILARTRPTTLDLAIAVASGLAGAVVTVSREKRLSASIPGVAIAVALIPPLAVAGFGLGTGVQWDLIRGSLLLFGANLGGIVLSGMAAFLLVGMHREHVVAAAREWHESGQQTGLAARLERSAAFRRLRVFATPWARVGLVLVFVAAVSVPLASSLNQVVRESRVQRAVSGAVQATESMGAFVLGRSLEIGDGGSTARLRVATERWIGEDAREEIARAASAAAGEAVDVRLDQVIVSDSQAEELRAASTPAPVAAAVPSPPDPLTTPELFAELDGRMEDALGSLVLPDGVEVLGAEVALGPGSRVLLVAYSAERRLALSSEALIARSAARAVGLDERTARAVALTPVPIPADSVGARKLAALVAPYPRVRLVVEGDSLAAQIGAARLAQAGVAPGRVRWRVRPGAARVRFATP